jgi:hypothetical protein
MQISGRYHPNQPFGVSQRKGEMQPATFVCPSEGMKARLNRAVFRVWKDKQRRVEKNLLRFSHRNFMPLILPGVSLIPFEANDLREINH